MVDVAEHHHRLRTARARRGPPAAPPAFPRAPRTPPRSQPCRRPAPCLPDVGGLLIKFGGLWLVCVCVSNRSIHHSDGMCPLGFRRRGPNGIMGPNGSCVRQPVCPFCLFLAFAFAFESRPRAATTAPLRPPRAREFRSTVHSPCTHFPTQNL